MPTVPSSWKRQISIVIVFSVFVVMGLTSASGVRESFRSMGTTPFDRFRSILSTQTEFSTDPLTLYCDLRDANDQQTCAALRARFPLRLSKWNINFAKHMHAPFMVMCPEFAIAELSKQIDRPLRFVANTHRVAMTLIADSELPVHSWNDVTNSTIVVFENHFSEMLLRSIFELIDATIKIIAVNTYQEMYDTWNRGDADLIFLLCSHPNPFVSNLSYIRRIKLIPWDLIFQNTREGPLNNQALAGRVAKDGGSTKNTMLDIQLLQFSIPGILSIDVPLWFHDCEKNGRTRATKNDVPFCQIKRYNVVSLDQYHRTYGFRMMLLGSDDAPSHNVRAFVQMMHEQSQEMHTTMRWMVRDSSFLYCPPALQMHPGVQSFIEGV